MEKVHEDTHEDTQGKCEIEKCWYVERQKCKGINIIEAKQCPYNDGEYCDR